MSRSHIVGQKVDPVNSVGIAQDSGATCTCDDAERKLLWPSIWHRLATFMKLSYVRGSSIHRILTLCFHAGSWYANKSTQRKLTANSTPRNILTQNLAKLLNTIVIKQITLSRCPWANFSTEITMNQLTKDNLTQKCSWHRDNRHDVSLAECPCAFSCLESHNCFCALLGSLY